MNILFPKERRGVGAARPLRCHDPFWPRIDIDLLRLALGACADVSEARLEVAVLAATIEVNRDWSGLRRGLRAQGYKALAEVPRIGPETDVSLYLAAIQRAAKAHLERYTAAMGEDCEP